MQIIRVSQTASTNAFLKDYVRTNKPSTALCVVANAQDQGRGQMGTTWQSEPFKNLTFSVYIPSLNLPLQKRFVLTMLTGLAILEGLKPFNIPLLTLKWPNDIMAGSRKVGGVLIENQLESTFIKSSVIGIGLNVNQTDFNDLPKASSLKSVTSLDYDLDSLLMSILNECKRIPQRIAIENFDSIVQYYEQSLFKKDKLSVFSTEGIHSFNGIIRGVTKEGLLKLETEDGMHHYDLKEVAMQF